MKLQVRGQPAFKVSPAAQWCLNALAGGFNRPALATGSFSALPRPGPYQVLMEGLEAFSALLRGGLAEDDTERRYDYAPDGRRFLSAFAGSSSISRETTKSG